MVQYQPDGILRPGIWRVCELALESCRYLLSSCPLCWKSTITYSAGSLEFLGSCRTDNCQPWPSSFSPQIKHRSLGSKHARRADIILTIHDSLTCVPYMYPLFTVTRKFRQNIIPFEMRDYAPVRFPYRSEETSRGERNFEGTTVGYAFSGEDLGSILYPQSWLNYVCQTGALSIG